MQFDKLFGRRLPLLLLRINLYTSNLTVRQLCQITGWEGKGTVIKQQFHDIMSKNCTRMNLMNVLCNIENTI